MLRKNSNFQNPSPMRSPLKTPVRPVSPIRLSPFTRQGPLSPIKSRVAANCSTTPNKSRQGQRVQFVKSPLNCKQNIDVGHMQKTLKNGVGLFQQLAYQNKIGSERKENRITVQNTNPFEYSEKKRETMANYSKNSFAALIQNVKQIESIQASKANYLSNQVSFKTIQKSNHMEGTLVQEPIIRRKNSQYQQPVTVLESFGSPCQAQIKEVEKSQKSQIKKFQVTPLAQVEEIQQKSRVQEEAPKKTKEQMISSFEDVILLIKKASQKVKDESSVAEDEVKMSFESRLSFNMNPFI